MVGGERIVLYVGTVYKLILAVLVEQILRALKHSCAHVAITTCAQLCFNAQQDLF